MVTVSPSDLARLSAAVPLLGAFAKPGRATLTIDDFDAISDDLWTGTGYGRT